MLKWLVIVLAVVTSSMAYAQDAPPRLSEANWKVLRDARIGMVKAALQLKPDQEKYWPAVEKAIRERAEARYKRIEAVRERTKQGGGVDPIELLRSRADALTQRAASTKILADAWAPFYPTLDADQKERMRFLIRRTVGQMRTAMETLRMRALDEQGDLDDDDGED